MPHLDQEKTSVYASPWIKISDSHFIRNLVDIHAQPTELKPMHDRQLLARVIGKVKKGVATWTWNIFVRSYFAKSTGTCTNKRDAMLACEEALKQERVILLKPKHLSFL